MSDLPAMTSSPRERLILPFMAPFHHHFAQPVGWLIFRAKAEFNSTFWTAGAALIAAFGGGRLSADRWIGREF